MSPAVAVLDSDMTKMNRCLPLTRPDFHTGIFQLGRAQQGAQMKADEQTSDRRLPLEAEGMLTGFIDIWLWDGALGRSGWVTQTSPNTVSLHQ